MNRLARSISLAAVFVAVVSGCSGSGNSPPNDNQSSGTISLSLTDGPWHDAGAMMLHITAVELGHVDGHVVHLGLPGGGMGIDMMLLQNGIHRELMGQRQVPAGHYEWMRLILDMSQSYVDMAQGGGRHGMHMGADAADGLVVHHPFEITESAHHEFMLDYDLRLGLHHQHMGMMGDRFELHSAMRMVHMNHAGGLMGVIDPALIDVNHADCDPAPGGNWAYLFPADAVGPDDIALDEVDGIPGPLATDRVEMNPATGDYYYHFAYLADGSYRIAFTCSGEWDESGDDDYPADPDGLFDFQMFSDPIDVVAGEMHRFDLVP